MLAKILIIKTHITTIRTPSISILAIMIIMLNHQLYTQSIQNRLFLQNSTLMSIHILNTCTLLISAQRLRPSTKIYAPVLRMTTVNIVARPTSLPHLTSTQLKSVNASALMLSIISLIMALAQTVGLLSMFLILSQMKDQGNQSRLVKIRPLQFSQTLVLM